MAIGDMNIVSMERTDAEKKAAEERYSTMAPSDGPDYPWGLCLNLGREELAKLGIDDLPAVGDEFHIYAVCKVTRVSQSASEQGEDSKGVELQITSMGAMPEDETKETQTAFSKAANKLYGKAESAEGE
jgi:hypothetical protein